MASHLDGHTVVARAIRRLVVAVAVVAGALAVSGAAGAGHGSGSPAPDFGPNVVIFDPSLSTSQIQATVDAIATQQVSNQFGTQRYALLFMPGTYGSAAEPLIIQVGYYTEVAGLGASPNDVINGTIDVYNQCVAGGCTALVNFWRSVSNLTIDVMGLCGCQVSADFWAISQAAPMRRVDVDGLSLMDYCTRPAVRERRLHRRLAVPGSFVINGSQQQFLVRDSSHRRLDERGLEPGLRRRPRAPRPRRSPTRPTRPSPPTR